MIRSGVSLPAVGLAVAGLVMLAFVSQPWPLLVEVGGFTLQAMAFVRVWRARKVNGIPVSKRLRQEMVNAAAMGGRVCPVCERPTFQPVDVLTGWCGNCARFTGLSEKQVRKAIEQLKAAGEYDVATSAIFRLDSQVARDKRGGR